MFMIGRMLMKIPYQAFAVLLGLWMGASMAHSQTTSDALTRINSLKTAIDTQIERIKTTRDSTDGQISLARLRVGEQIRKSQEDLAVQMELLQRLREQLEEQKAQTEQSVARMNNDLSTLSTTAFSAIEEQISKTNDLIGRMEKIRQEVSGESSTTSLAAPSASSNPGAYLSTGVSTSATNQEVPNQSTYSPITVTVTPNPQPAAGSSSEPVATPPGST
jgi:hypothetical protein